MGTLCYGDLMAKFEENKAIMDEQLKTITRLQSQVKYQGIKIANLEKISNSLKEIAFDHFGPEDIFPASDLTEWAYENGLTKA